MKTTPRPENSAELIKTIVNSLSFSVSCIAGIIEDYSQLVLEEKSVTVLVEQGIGVSLWTGNRLPDQQIREW